MVSDEMSHSTATVNVVLDKIIPLFKKIDPQVEMLHYWTDGQISQYCSKQISFTVAKHLNIYGMHAKWNYFEVGHGKGPFDGLRGMTDEAV